ncbi:MAG: glycosyltransferase family 4 protein [Bacteroidales bacterium]|nr:glycosyltransferase family 4 protein [Bacteroidales bacterium]
MKILSLCNFDIHGGAARAMLRLHNGLKDAGIDSKILVCQKNCDDNSIFETHTGRLSKIINKTYQHYIRLGKGISDGSVESRFHPRLICDNIIREINKFNPDIVHLHWLSESFVKTETLSKIKVPIVWTLHDMWPFTGGCNYDNYCGKYKLNCGKCPLLKSNKDNDLSRKQHIRKYNYYNKIENLTIVSPSKWLGESAKESSLFSKRTIKIIPYGIDTNKFKPVEKNKARNILNLPPDKKIILFGAIGATSDERKGFKYIIPSLQKLKYQNIEFAVFGSSKGSEINENPKFKTNFFGHLKDDDLILLYSAADVMLAPSVQENLALTIIESLSCSTPVVSFDIGGNKDMINHKNNGYLAKPFETDDFAAGIDYVLSEEKNTADSLQENARKKVLCNFTNEISANSYIKLYKEILN